MAIRLFRYLRQKITHDPVSVAADVEYIPTQSPALPGPLATETDIVAPEVTDAGTPEMEMFAAGEVTFPAFRKSTGSSHPDGVEKSREPEFGNEPIVLYAPVVGLNPAHLHWKPL